MANNPPHLSISTQPPSSGGPGGPGPSTIRNRPLGARRRGVTPGLFIANPDNSDDEGSPSSLSGDRISQRSRSPVKASPVTASSTSSNDKIPRASSGSGDGSSPRSGLGIINGGGSGGVGGSGGGGGGGGGGSGGGGVPILPPSGSPATHSTSHLPTIPAPQPSPQPWQSVSSLPLPSTARTSTPPTPPSHAPLPPPQPERHMRRAQTTPVPEHSPARGHESRGSLGSIPPRDLPPGSPSRALPPLPNTSSPSIPGTSSPSQLGPGPPSSYPPPTPNSAVSAESSRQASQPHEPRISSPEDMMSLATNSEASKSFVSLVSSDLEGRVRSGSVQGKTRVQVTVDNESFTTVDITGMHTAEGIKERVFAKLRFRDDEHENLSLFLTDVDEQPDTTPLSDDSFLRLCLSKGDAKANLKFFVMQKHFADSAMATVVPPINPAPYHPRPAVSPITTDLNGGLNRTPSKDGSLGSELYDKGTTSTSEWSEVNPDEAASFAGSSRGPRAAGRPATAGRLEPTSSPASNTQGSVTASSATIATPPPVIHVPSVHEIHSAASSPATRPQDASASVGNPAQLPTYALPRHPLHDEHPEYEPSGTAGPSRQPSGGGLGLQMEDDMDPATKALIAKLQEEEAQISDARRRQLEADEELARREQRAERDVWEMMQEMEMEQARARTTQIEQDERRAREVEEEERRQEDQRQAHEARAADEAARTAWELEQQEAEREQEPSRHTRFTEERRQRAQHYREQGGQGAIRESSFDSQTLPTLGPNRNWAASPFGDGTRRPSDSHYDASRQHQYPATNPMFDKPVYSPSSYENPGPANFAARGQALSGRFEGPGDRNDPRFRPMPGDHPGRNAFMGVGAGGRGSDSRAQRPFAALNTDPESLSSPLQNTRSMDNLRPYTPSGVPVSRSPWEGVPPRTAVTPGPGVIEHGAYSPTMYRTSSMERAQDSRYPDVISSAPSRSFPVNINGSPSSPRNGLMNFPSPQPRTGSTSSLPFTGSPQSDSGRPSSAHYDRTPPGTASTQTPGMRRPSTFHDELNSAPATARTTGRDDAWAQWRSEAEHKPRRGSTSAAHPAAHHLSPRRASESSVFADDHEDDSASTWLAVPRSRRHDTGDSSNFDTHSLAGTVSSQATTVKPGRRGSGDHEEEDSSSTAKADDWQTKLRQMIEKGGHGGAQFPMAISDDDEDEEEATLFLPASSQKSNLTRGGTLRRSISRPNLFIETMPDGYTSGGHGSNATTPSGSESESRHGSASASYRKGSNQWHLRPEPEALYEDLDRFFPHIDLDKPIVEGHVTAPSTPASGTASPQSATAVAPPIHPSRHASQPSPKPEDQLKPLPPPLHPGRGDPSRGPFNKAENRKSIRVLAEHKRKTLFKDVRHAFGGGDSHHEKKEKEEEKPKRRMTMWGKTQEVTPSKLINGQLPAIIPESPAPDGKPATLNWVKGKLLGKGSYGSVYIAMNVTTGDMMAVKQVELLSDGGGSSGDRRQMGMIDALKSEIALLKDLYHPNIVAYLGCETSLDFLSIFLEYVPGGTIATIYRTPNQDRFEEQLVKFFTKQILEGLAYLHHRNILHRDLKGDNILVDAEGVCKISDFGISKKANDAYDSFAPNATTMRGSVFWMAPEMLKGGQDKTYSGKVDIWSLGCVVVEMWTGKRPWGEFEQVAAMFELFTHRRAPPLPDDIKLSETAMDFMDRQCFSPLPEDRPTAMELLGHPFITNVDHKWSFAHSKIGKAVAKRVPKTLIRSYPA